MYLLFLISTFMVFNTNPTNVIADIDFLSLSLNSGTLNIVDHYAVNKYKKWMEAHNTKTTFKAHTTHKSWLLCKLHTNQIISRLSPRPGKDTNVGGFGITHTHTLVIHIQRQAYGMALLAISHLLLHGDDGFMATKTMSRRLLSSLCQ
jgi:hypothetical protein